MLPPSISLGSNRYRSQNDTSVIEASKNATPYHLLDTPGHGKLRLDFSFPRLNDPHLKGVIFLVDSATLESDATTLRDAAAYLYDVLLHLQKRKKAKSRTGQSMMHVLIAANKQDLFTALPAASVKERLEMEIENVKQSRTRGVAGIQAESTPDEEDLLGGAGGEHFRFKMLEDEDYDITVEVAGGAIRGEEAGKGVRRWEEWIGGCL